MNNSINRTTVAAQVNGVFALGLQDRIKAAVHSPYQVDLFAEQDYRTLVSMIYTVRSDIVSLMDGSDVPLQDIPKEGSLDENDTGRESDLEIERRELLKQAVRCAAILERHAESLEERARKDLEEAGLKVVDGGRYRLSRKTQEFKGYLNSWEDFLIDLKSKAKEGSAWLRKIERAVDVQFPFVSAQDATDEFMEYFEDENVAKVSAKAWEKLLNSFEQLGRELSEHEARQINYNELDAIQRKIAASDFAKECAEHKQFVRNSEYWIERFMQPWQLLCATGVPASLIESPEWRTKESEIRAAKARAKVSEVRAQCLEIEAANAEVEAALAMKAARARLAALYAQGEALDCLMNPKVEAESTLSVSPVIQVHTTRSAATAASVRGPRARTA